MIALMRRYAFGFVNSHDFEVPAAIMDPGYTLHMGSDTLVGRDGAYLPAVRHQIDQFPNLGFSIHDLITDGTRTALLFSEHGVSARDPRCAAAWAGVSIYRRDGDHLAECWVEQDHYGRRRQLKTGHADPLLPVAIDPWSGHDAPADQAAAAASGARAVESWAESARSWPPEGAVLDPGSASSEQPRLRLDRFDVNALVCEGDRVAFNLTLHGAYDGGLPDFDHRVGTPVETYVGAFATITDGGLGGVVGVSNRVALQRQLRG